MFKGDDLKLKKQVEAPGKVNFRLTHTHYFNFDWWRCNFQKESLTVLRGILLVGSCYNSISND